MLLQQPDEILTHHQSQPSSATARRRLHRRAATISPWINIPLSQTYADPFFLLSGPGRVRTYATTTLKKVSNGHRLPHLTASSEVHVISVASKQVTHRVALAIGHVRFSQPQTLSMVKQNDLKKGDVLAVSRVAGLQAVKKTSDIIPLAHSGLPVEGIIVMVQPVNSLSSSRTAAQEQTIDTNVEDSSGEDPGATIHQLANLHRPIGDHGGIRIAAQVETTAKTGVEMEALTGVMGAALTVVDMIKSVDKGVSIEEVKVIGKKGGRSGGWGVWADE